MPINKITPTKRGKAAIAADPLVALERCRRQSRPVGTRLPSMGFRLQ